MSRRYVQMTDLDGVSAYVNADHVSYIRPEIIQDTEDYCIVYFSNGKYLKVKEKAISLVQKIMNVGG